MVRWVWASIRPGMTVRLGSSMRVAPGGTLAWAAGVMLTMRSFSMTMIWSVRGRPLLTCNGRAACTATGRAVGTAGWAGAPAQAADSNTAATTDKWGLSLFIIASPESLI